MLSNRLVVSRAASSLLSWRLAVFIFHCLLVGCLGAAWAGCAACFCRSFRSSSRAQLEVLRALESHDEEQEYLAGNLAAEVPAGCAGLAGLVRFL